MTEIKRLVERLKRTYETSDPFELCEYLDITPLMVPLPARIRGFFNRMQGYGFIYINDALPERERTIVCGHELGHALLHTQLNSMFILSFTYLVQSKLENEADYFCACLLLEEADDYYREYGLTTLAQIAQLTGFDERVVALRYEELAE